MAAFQALTMQTGRFTQIGTADRILIGRGIENNDASAVMQIGVLNATPGIEIGQSGQPLSLFGNTAARRISSFVATPLDIDSQAALTLGATTATSMTVGRSGISIGQAGDWVHAVGTYFFTGGAWNVQANGAAVLDATASITIGGTGATSLLLGRVGQPTVLKGNIAFYNGTAQPQQTVTGLLSGVVDVNARNVLTSILAALGTAGTGYSLVINATT